MRREEIKNTGAWKRRRIDRHVESVRSNYSRLFEVANLNLQVLSTSTQIEKLLK